MMRRIALLLMITLLSFTNKCNAQENIDQESLSLFIKSVAYLQNRDYPHYVDILENAYNLQNQTYGNSNHEFDVYLFKGLARGYNYLYDINKSIYYQNKAVEEQCALSGEKDEDYIDLLNDLAILYSRAENYKKVIETGNRILNICGEMTNVFTEKNVAGYKVNMAQAYLALGNSAEAKSILEKSVMLYEKDRQNIRGFLPIIDYISVVSTYSSACLYSGEIDKAIDYNDKAIEVCIRDTGMLKTDYYATLIANKSLSYDFKGDWDMAIKYAKEALYIRKTLGGEYNTSYLMSLNNIAKLEMLKRLYDEAETKFGRCVDICDSLGIRNNLYFAFKLNITICEFVKSNNQCKYDFIGDIKEVYSYTRQNIINNFLWLTADERKVLLRKSMMNYLKFFIPFVAYNEPKSEMTEMCYDFSLLLKGQLLNTQIGLIDLIAQSNDKQLIEMMNNLRAQRAFLTHQYQIPVTKRTLSNIDSLENKCKEEESSIIEKSNIYGNYAQSVKLTWSDVQQALKPNDTAIEFLNFYIGNDSMEYVAMVINKDMQYPKMIPLALKSDYDRYLNNMYSGEACVDMYNLVWKPIEPYLHEGGKVYFSPSGMFYQSNIEVLRDSSGRMASEKYNLYRVSSTREICNVRDEQRPRSAMLYGDIDYFMSPDDMVNAVKRYHKSDVNDFATRGFNNDSADTRGPLMNLDGTQREVENIADELKKGNINVSVVTGKDGTEESFKALSGKRYGIIHLATHGFFFDNEKAKDNVFINNIMMNDDRSAVDMSMKRSGLAFAGANNAWSGKQIQSNIDDGILLAEEIPNIDLRGCDLLVLSACQTGLGDVTSEGVFGLQRGFKQAGVKTIVMSLWNVKDVASLKFMTLFYNNLVNGQSKRQAFLNAQKSLRNSKEFNDPKDWAAFIMLDGI
jgi:CHAT domain-containing protein